MKNLVLYCIKLLPQKIKTSTKQSLFITILFVHAALPSYAEMTLKQAIEQEREQDIASNLDDEIQDAVIDRLAQLELEAQQKNQTKDTSNTLETEPTTAKTETSPTPTGTTSDNTAQAEEAQQTSTILETEKIIVTIDTPVKEISKEPETKQETAKVETTTTTAAKKETPNTRNKLEVAMVEKEEAENKTYTDKNRNKPTSTKTTTQNTVKTKMTTVGWIYLGRFTSGQWENPTLGAKTLPKVKQRYKVIATSVNVRDRLPKKDAMGELVLGESIKQLVDKQEVALLQLKRSGRNGHYWGKIGVIGK